MELTTIAGWLNAAFASYDYAILAALHELAVAAGWFFTPVFTVISLFADDGIFLLVLSAALMLFKKTRRVGLCMFVAILVGAIITNLVLKNLVVRPRPFDSDVSQFHEWWLFTGSVEELSFSFPSGHTTATMAAMTALFLCLKTRARWLCFVPVLLMGASRNYLMVHYPSDILGGFLAGAAGAIVAYFIIRALYRHAESHAGTRLAQVLLDFDLGPFLDRKGSAR